MAAGTVQKTSERCSRRLTGLATRPTPSTGSCGRTVVTAGTTISDNEHFGVVAKASNTTTNINNSAISGNKLFNGGFGMGIRLFRVNLNVTNSTISHSEGGGLVQILLPTSSTGAWTVKSSIVAANASGLGDVRGAFTSGGFNVIGRADGSTGFAHGVNNDQAGSGADSDSIADAHADAGPGTALGQDHAAGPNQLWRHRGGPHGAEHWRSDG